jgi:hypothetical protein
MSKEAQKITITTNVRGFVEAQRVWSRTNAMGIFQSIDKDVPWLLFGLDQTGQENVIYNSEVILSIHDGWDESPSQ